MRLSVYFAPTLSTQNFQTNQFKRTLRDKSFWNFGVDYTCLCLKILGLIIEKFQRCYFCGKLIIWDFRHFRKLKKIGKYYTQKTAWNILRLTAWFDKILAENGNNFAEDPNEQKSPHELFSI